MALHGQFSPCTDILPPLIPSTMPGCARHCVVLVPVMPDCMRNTTIPSSALQWLEPAESAFAEVQETPRQPSLCCDLKEEMRKKYGVCRAGLRKSCESPLSSAAAAKCLRSELELPTSVIEWAALSVEGVAATPLAADTPRSTSAP